MVKRVARKAFGFKTVALLAVLGLSNLAPWDKGQDPIQECCETLAARIVFNPDPVKVCQANVGATQATFTDGEATWRFSIKPPSEAIANSNIDRGPGRTSGITLQAVDTFPKTFDFFGRKADLVKKAEVMATPAEGEDRTPVKRWLTLRLQQLTVVSEPVLPGVADLGVGGGFGKESKVELRLGCGFFGDEEADGEWTFTLGPLQRSEVIVMREEYERLGISTAPLEVTLSPDGIFTARLTNATFNGCLDPVCEGSARYGVKARLGTAEVDRSITVRFYVSPP